MVSQILVITADLMSTWMCSPSISSLGRGAPICQRSLTMDGLFALPGAIKNLPMAHFLSPLCGLKAIHYPLLNTRRPKENKCVQKLVIRDKKKYISVTVKYSRGKQVMSQSERTAQSWRVPDILFVTWPLCDRKRTTHIERAH